MAATNRLRSQGMKGVLRQMPGLGVARIVAATASSGLSAYTQQGAYPGVPEADSTVTELFVKATGTIPEDEREITVQTLHGGMVGLGEASFIWSQEITTPVINTGSAKGSLDPVRGFEWPSYPTFYEALEFDDDPGVDMLDAGTLSDGRILQAYRIFDVGSSVSVIVKVRALDGTWTDVTVYSSTDTNRTVLLPCLVVLPDDRVIVYLMNYPPGGDTFQLQARVIYPSDLSVGDYEVACLKTSLAISAYGAPDEGSQLRGAIKPDGTTMLVLATDISGTTQILQLGSYDWGHSFSVVSYGGGTSDDDNYTLPDVVYANGSFVVSYVEAIAGDEGVAVLVVVKRLSHYFDSLVEAPELATYTEEADAITDRHITGNALVATPDGMLYGVNTVANDSTREVYGHVHVCLDQGATWTNSVGDDKPNVGYDAGSPGPSWLYYTAGSGTVVKPQRICATWQGSRLYVGSLFVKDSGSDDDFDDGSVLAFYLGGGSNQQKAFFDNLAKVPDGQLSYKYTAFGFHDPEFNGWSKTSSGTNSGQPIGGRRTINTSDGGKLYYTRTGGTNISTCSVEFDFTTELFNTIATGDVGVTIQIDNGTLKYLLGLYFVGTGSVATTGLVVRDLVAGSTIATIPLDFTDEYTFRVEQYNGKFQLWYRPASSTEDQVWERAKDPFSGTTYAGYTLTSTASTGASAAVTWGHLFATTTGSTGDCVSNWRRVLCNFGTNLADGAVSSGIKNWFIASWVDSTSTDDFHNGYPYVSDPVWLVHGVNVLAVGGPTYFHDEWVINPSYQYGIKNIMPEWAPSPTKLWRSTGDDVDVAVCWLVGTGDTGDAIAGVLAELPGNESIGLWIMGATFRTATLVGVKSDNSEVTIIDIDLTRFSGLTFSNHGNTTRVLAGGGTTYVAPGELAGAYLINSGEPTPKRITTNKEGQLNDDTKSATIWFEASLTEDQGVDADPGNCIFMPSGFFVRHDPPADQFKAYRLKIPAQETAEGYFQAKVMFGPLDIFGIPPAYGFSTELEQDNTLRNKTTAGHTETRVYNGPPRVKALAWESLDQTMLDQADPDYIQFPDGDEPAALFDDAARQIYGMFREMNGADELCVYCDKIPEDTNTGELCPERFQYGRLTSTFQESNRVGNEGVNELVQLTNLVHEEEK